MPCSCASAVLPNRSCSKRVQSHLCSHEMLREPLEHHREVEEHVHVSRCIGDSCGKTVVSRPPEETNRRDCLGRDCLGWACGLHCCSPFSSACRADRRGIPKADRFSAACANSSARGMASC